MFQAPWKAICRAQLRMRQTASALRVFREYNSFCLRPWRSWTLFNSGQHCLRTLTSGPLGPTISHVLSWKVGKTRKQEGESLQSHRASQGCLDNKIRENSQALEVPGLDCGPRPMVHGRMSPFDSNRTSLKWVFEIPRKRGPRTEELIPRLLQPCSNPVGTQDVLTPKAVQDRCRVWVRVWLKNQTSLS